MICTPYAANLLEDLKAPPSNKLHALERDRAGRHAIWNNDQYRFCFRGTENGPADVEITDYHRAIGVMTETFEVVQISPPIHPGEILREEFLVPLGLSAGRVAKAIGIGRSRIERLAAGEIGISADTAIRLGRFFKTTPQFGLNLQKHYELEQAIAAMGEAADRIVPFASAA